jgi:glycosyltransferase involved in cell wall biosynthesis
MKIIMTTDYFPPYLGGGVENVVFEISKRLTLKGHEVHVLTSSSEGAPSYEIMEGISVYRVEYIDLTKIFGLQTIVSFRIDKMMVKLIKSIKPDIINAHNLFFYSSLIAAREKMNYPLVTTLHLSNIDQIGGFSGFFAKTYERTIGKYIINRSDRLIAVSKSVRKQALSLGALEKRIDVIPNAVDPNIFKPRKETNQELKVVYVGRLISNKGPQFFIDAAEKISKNLPNISFTMIGDGPMLNVLKTRIYKHGLNNKINLIGTVPKLSEILPKYDILIRPSLTEGMPLTILEGMACGLAVISSNVAGVPEIITDNVNGLLISPGKVDEIESAVTRLVTNQELLTSIRFNARHYIESYLTWDKVADMTLQSYSKVLET